MDTLKRKLRRLLEDAFPGSSVRLDSIPRSDRIMGFVVWEGFAEMEPLDRQDRLWSVLHEKLPQDERSRVSGLFTVTEQEQSLARANGHAA